MDSHPLYPVNRRHLAALTGEHGIWQHATGPDPNLAFGTCSDDVARALVVDLRHGQELGWAAVSSSAWRSLRYLIDAFDPSTGRFRNFRAANGRWLDGDASEDSHGRTIRALGSALGQPENHFGAAARRLFLRALPAATGLRALRAMASSILGCEAAMASTDLDDEVRRAAAAAMLQLSRRLGLAIAARERIEGWPWPEPALTYENALLPHALIVGGTQSGDRELTRVGLASLDWLIDVQTSREGWLSPIGNAGFWRFGAERARFDQQPIEATTTLLAAEAAHEQTGERRYLATVEQCYGWFLGANDVGVPVADPEVGACFDGLERSGVNRNQGAESTLMWLTALEHVRGIRRSNGLPARALDCAVVAIPTLSRG